MKNNFNICLSTDAYKTSMQQMFPKKIEYVYSYFIACGGSEYQKIVFFGLHYILKHYLAGKIITQKKINEAEKYINQHFGKEVFNKADWEYILHTYGGKLPVKIKAVKEGTVIGNNNVILTIENTDPKCFWLTNFLETILAHVWYTCAFATKVNHIKTMLLDFANKTSDDISFVETQLHNFVAHKKVQEAVGLSGAAHLLFFKSTDNIEGIQIIHNYYNTKIKDINTYSILPSFKNEGELKLLDVLLDKFPEGRLAVSIDGFDFIDNITTKYKDKILERNGQLLFCLDGNDQSKELIHMVESLAKSFGYYQNTKNYKIINSHIRLMCRDITDSSTIKSILDIFEQNGWSSENIVFGMSEDFTSKINSTDSIFLCKIGSNRIDGKWHNICKSTKIDDISFDDSTQYGKLLLIKNKSEYKTIGIDIEDKNDTEVALIENEVLEDYKSKDNLLPIFYKGKILNQTCFNRIKKSIDYQ